MTATIHGVPEGFDALLLALAAPVVGWAAWRRS